MRRALRSLRIDEWLRSALDDEAWQPASPHARHAARLCRQVQQRRLANRRLAREPPEHECSSTQHAHRTAVHARGVRAHQDERAVLDRALPMAEVGEAHRLLEAREALRASLAEAARPAARLEEEETKQR